MDMDILRQHTWTDEELIAAGFHRYHRRKNVVLARELPAHEAPKIIHVELDTLIARAGSVILYEVNGGDVYPDLDGYPHRPIEPEEFHRTYRPWDETWTPTPAQAHLLAHGCEPYYKAVGVWAKQVDERLWVQSMESIAPVEAPVGAWVLIGASGEPYLTTDAEFQKRYQPV
jgi:hypothetical protein